MLRGSYGFLAGTSILALCLFAALESARSVDAASPAGQGRGRASCSVAPNPVTLGANYQVESSHVGSNTPSQVRVTEADLIRTFDVVSNAAGSFSLTVPAERVGAGTVEVIQFKKNRSSFVLTKCFFQVTQPSACGDGFCSPDEDCRSCHADCTCPPRIPPATAWTDHGLFLSAGGVGEWDHILWGGFAHAIVKRDGRFYFYYQGSRYYDDYYGTVGFRSIGVATSDDGIHFSKFAGNPLVQWLPNNWLEEGAVSSGVSLAPSGQIALFYGANTKLDDWQVNADGRFALSEDGMTFRDLGIALDRRNRSIWGSGDELFPIVSLPHAGLWYVYYLPNGTAQARKLGVAWGSDALDLSSSAGAIDQNGAAISAWGPGSFAPLGGGDYALFLNNGSTISAWRMNIAAPDRLTGPVVTYTFPNMSWGVLLLDGDTWYLYYLNNAYNAYGVRTAPAF